MNDHKHLGNIGQGAHMSCIECNVLSIVFVLLTQDHMCNGGTQMIAIYSHSDLE